MKSLLFLDYKKKGVTFIINLCLLTVLYYFAIHGQNEFSNSIVIIHSVSIILRRDYDDNIRMMLPINDFSYGLYRVLRACFFGLILTVIITLIIVQGGKSFGTFLHWMFIVIIIVNLMIISESTPSNKPILAGLYNLVIIFSTIIAMYQIERNFSVTMVPYLTLSSVMILLSSSMLFLNTWSRKRYGYRLIQRSK